MVLLKNINCRNSRAAYCIQRARLLLALNKDIHGKDYNDIVYIIYLKINVKYIWKATHNYHSYLYSRYCFFNHPIIIYYQLLVLSIIPSLILLILPSESSPLYWRVHRYKQYWRCLDCCVPNSLPLTFVYKKKSKKKSKSSSFYSFWKLFLTAVNKIRVSWKS